MLNIDDKYICMSSSKMLFSRIYNLDIHTQAFPNGGIVAHSCDKVLEYRDR